MRGHHAFEACVEQLATAIRLGVYPLGTTLPSGARARRPAHGLPGDAAGGDGRAARGRPGRDPARPRRRHRRDDQARAPPRPARPRARSPEQRADWLDALEFRRVVEPGAARLAAPRRADDAERGASSRQPTRRSPAPPPGRAPAGRLALPPDHRRAHAAPRALIDAVTSVQASLHEMLSAIPVLEANIAHSDRQHRACSGRSWRPYRAAARSAMEEHCDDTAALLRGLLDERDQVTEERPHDRTQRPLPDPGALTA